MNEPSADPGVYVPEAGKVAIRDPDGSVWKVPQANLSKEMADGARPATEAEYFGAESGRGGEVASGVVGAARTATFGLSDPAYVEAARLLGGDENAEDTRHTLRLLKEANPRATFTGEMLGVVPSAFMGGDGGALRLAGEGAALGAGAQLSEDTLQNHAFNGEAYLRAGGLGLLTGVGLAAGAKALGKIAPMFGRGAARAEEGLVERALTRAEEGGPFRAAGVRAEEAAAETGGRKSIMDRLEEARDFATYKATGANRTDVKALGKTADDQLARMEDISGRLRGETFEGKSLVEMTASENEINRRINGRANEVGKELGAMRAKLDETLERPSMSAIRERFEAEAAGPALEHLGGEEAVAKVRAKLDEMTRLGGEAPTFARLHTLRRDLEPLAKYSQIAPKAETEMFRALRNITEEEFTTAGERAATSIGETFADDYRLSKALYSDLAAARSASNRAVGRGMGNNVVSLRDIGAGITGVATAGPIGLAAAGASMVGRRYGNQIASHVLDKAVQMKSVQRAASTLDTLLNDGTAAFVAGKKVAAKTSKAASSEEIRALREATRSTDAVTARVAESLGDLPKYAPKVAQEAAIVAARAAAWLQHALPKDAPPVSMFGPQRPVPLSDTQRLKATATIEGVTDPALVVERLNQGKLTPEHVAALRYVHPEAFAKIQGYLAQHQAELNKTMTQQQLFTLSLLFGTPLTEAALPENVRALQASFTQGNQAPGSAGQGGNTGAPAGMNAGPVMGGGKSATAFDMDGGK